LTLGDEFAPIAAVKPVLPALLPTLFAVVCAFTACQTTADHFDLFAPNKAQGPATEKLRGMTLAGRYNHQSTTYTVPVTSVAGAGPETGPIAPPPLPPPPGLPETNVGAPAATPLPAAVPSSSISGQGASATVVPGGTAPVTTPTTGSEPTAIPGLAPAPAGGASPAPAIPGLTQ
jgi:hypothetical protein